MFKIADTIIRSCEMESLTTSKPDFIIILSKQEEDFKRKEFDIKKLATN